MAYKTGQTPLRSETLDLTTARTLDNPFVIDIAGSSIYFSPATSFYAITVYLSNDNSIDARDIARAGSRVRINGHGAITGVNFTRAIIVHDAYPDLTADVVVTDDTTAARIDFGAQTLAAGGVQPTRETAPPYNYPHPLTAEYSGDAVDLYLKEITSNNLRFPGGLGYYNLRNYSQLVNRHLTAAIVVGADYTATATDNKTLVFSNNANDSLAVSGQGVVSNIPEDDFLENYASTRYGGVASATRIKLPTRHRAVFYGVQIADACGQNSNDDLSLHYSGADLLVLLGTDADTENDNPVNADYRLIHSIAPKSYHASTNIGDSGGHNETHLRANYPAFIVDNEGGETQYIKFILRSRIHIKNSGSASTSLIMYCSSVPDCSLRFRAFAI